MEVFFTLRKKVRPKFPLTDFKIWDTLRAEHENNGYEFVNFDVCKSWLKIKKEDIKNLENFNKTKKHENAIRNSVRGVQMATIKAPPSENNQIRFKKLKEWRKKRSSFDISMATAMLLKEYNKFPCFDYEPQNAVEFYLKMKSENFKIEGNRQSELQRTELQRTELQRTELQRTELPNDQNIKLERTRSECQRRFDKMMAKPVTPTAPRLRRYDSYETLPSYPHCVCENLN